MRYLIISDIHGNQHALDAVLADAATLGYDATICLGDLVGYGADPASVIASVQQLVPIAQIRGNHDKVVAGLAPASLFNDAAKYSAEWTQRVLSPAELLVLAGLPQGPVLVETPDDGPFEICHGAPFDEDHYILEDTDAARALSVTRTPLCLFGHTHWPAVYSTDESTAKDGLPPGEIRPLDEDEVVLPRRGRALINVGAVGQPRDRDPRAAYGLLDTARQTIRMRRVVYDVPGAQRRIMAAKLPAFLALRLERGR